MSCAQASNGSTQPRKNGVAVPWHSWRLKAGQTRSDRWAQQLAKTHQKLRPILAVTINYHVEPGADHARRGATPEPDCRGAGGRNRLASHFRLGWLSHGVRIRSDRRAERPRLFSPATRKFPSRVPTKPPSATHRCNLCGLVPSPVCPPIDFRPFEKSLACGLALAIELRRNPNFCRSRCQPALASGTAACRSRSMTEPSGSDRDMCSNSNAGCCPFPWRRQQGDRARRLCQVRYIGQVPL